MKCGTASRARSANNHPDVCRPLSFQSCAKIIGESDQITIIRGKTRELLGVFEGGTDVSGIAAERDEGQHGFAIVWVPGQVFLQHLHRLVNPAPRMQRAYVDIDIPGAIWLAFGRCPDFGEAVY